MNKNTVGKAVGVVGLFGSGLLIGAAIQDTVRTKAEQKQRAKDAAEDRLRLIEERLRSNEKEIERKDELIKQLTKRLDASQNK